MSSLPKDHDDHTAGKGHNSMVHYNLVHKLIPMPQAMKIPDATGAVEKKLNKLEAIPAWYLDKMKSKKEGILGTQRDKNNVHFGS